MESLLHLPEIEFVSELDVLNYASGIPYSQLGAVVNRFCGVPIDLGFGGSCIEKALIPFLCLPEGSSQLLWDPSCGHFAVSIETVVDGCYRRRYFDPTYGQIGIELTEQGFYPTMQGLSLQVKESSRGYNVRIFTQGDLYEKDWLGRKKPEAVYNMVPVDVPLDRAIDHVIGTTRRYPLKLAIKYGGYNPGETVSIQYSSEDDALMGRISNIFERTTSPASAEIFLGMQDRLGITSYELLDYFRDTWSRAPILAAELARRRYYDN